MGYSTVNSVTMTQAPTLLTGISQSHISSSLLPSSTAQHRPKPAMTDKKKHVIAAQFLINKDWHFSSTASKWLVAEDLWLHLTLYQQFMKYSGRYTRVSTSCEMAGKKGERVNDDPIRKHGYWEGRIIAVLFIFKRWYLMLADFICIMKKITPNVFCVFPNTNQIM